MVSLTNPLKIDRIEPGKQLFFISDLHLGNLVSKGKASHPEDRVLAWLDHILPKAAGLFLLGDIFDFWFEYRYLVPKCSLAFLSKLWHFHQAGIPIYYFLGNHDCWTIDYFADTLGMFVFKQPCSMNICGQAFFLGHGDTLNPTKWASRLSKLCQNRWLCALARKLPADFLYGLVHGHLLQRKQAPLNEQAKIKDDPLFLYCKNRIQPHVHHAYYLFGHMHCPATKRIEEASWYCNLGDWLFHDTYAQFDGINLQLCRFEMESK